MDLTHHAGGIIEPTEFTIARRLKGDSFGVVVLPGDEDAEFVTAVGASSFFELELFGVEGALYGLGGVSRGDVEIMNEGAGAFGGFVGDGVGVDFDMGVFGDELYDPFYEFFLVETGVVFVRFAQYALSLAIQGNTVACGAVAVFGDAGGEPGGVARALQEAEHPPRGAGKGAAAT